MIVAVCNLLRYKTGDGSGAWYTPTAAGRNSGDVRKDHVHTEIAKDYKT